MVLPRPRTSDGAAALGAIAARPSAALLAFDFDGTLAPIVPDPRDARPHPRALAALRALAPRVAGVAVVTGRPAETAVEYGLDTVPGIVVLGHYGLERWEDGSLTSPGAVPGLEDARAAIPGLLEDLGPLREGVHVEDKGKAVAVHTRRAARPAEALDALREPLGLLAERAGLAVEPGRMVIELRPPGMDKGAALTDLVGRVRPGALLYAGDDLGDLPAFTAVRELRGRGVPGVTVCSGSSEVPMLAGQADLVVEGPEGVAVLLEGLLP
ncbi:trehalose-phosphatase [Nocardiopsis sp. RSe5-2]|uniref:Trehalose 6-phosphate phosphatase n=1 Tax=Nocardiopsis endophytica TaxID=3018445 RepID=A0ABT4TYD0_9ACTN|nr:trehalose-phosphatase [Nocardiopsis endophytica]MDA2809698.1 trehalose-phosphatase [Nocardiopsis endophytica]